MSKKKNVKVKNIFFRETNTENKRIYKPVTYCTKLLIRLYEITSENA